MTPNRQLASFSAAFVLQQPRLHPRKISDVYVSHLSPLGHNKLNRMLCRQAKMYQRLVIFPLAGIIESLFSVSIAKILMIKSEITVFKKQMQQRNAFVTENCIFFIGIGILSGIQFCLPKEQAV